MRQRNATKGSVILRRRNGVQCIWLSDGSELLLNRPGRINLDCEAAL
jgi:hypothetical protein